MVVAYESGTVSDRSGTLCYVIERLERVRQWWGMDGVYKESNGIGSGSFW